MATVYDPIAKDESLNTTESPSRNIADVLAEGLKGIEDALPTYTEGDGIDISAQKEISVDTTFSEASTRANIASGESFSTILGKIKKFFTDLKAVAFSGAAEDVTYGSGSVKDALDELNPGSVSVTADGVKTYNSLLNELFALMDSSKVTPNSHLRIDGPDQAYVIIGQFTAITTNPLTYLFARNVIDSQQARLDVYKISSSGSMFEVVQNSTYQNRTNYVVPAGLKLTITY